jgi:hypothetical protein
MPTDVLPAGKEIQRSHQADIVGINAALRGNQGRTDHRQRRFAALILIVLSLGLQADLRQKRGIGREDACPGLLDGLLRHHHTRLQAGSTLHHLPQGDVMVRNRAV